MLRKLHLELPLLFFSVFLFAIYILNASRDIYGGDVGDLTTAACVGGVPHPPGFPLFSLLGFSFCQMSHVFPLSPVFTVGLVSVFAGVLGACLYYFLAKRSTNQSVALFSTAVLSFSYLYWLYSELAEVFVLNAFFAILLFFLAEKFRRTEAKKDFFIFCFTLGLSLTNHQMILFIFPALLLLIFKNLWKLKNDWKMFVFGTVCGMLGLSLYGYSVISSLNHPLLDWAHITNVQTFMDMILRKRYGTFSAGVFDTPSSQGTLIILKVYFQSLISQITFPGFLLCLIGIDRLLKVDKMRAISYSTAFLVSGPLFFGFAGFPLMSYFHAGVSERFLLLSTVMLLLFLPYGCQACIQGFYTLFPRRTYSTLLQCVLFLIPLLLFFYNYPKTNLAPLHYGDTVGKSFLTPLPKNAVVLMDGDTTLFNTWYVHLVLNLRPDVTVINMYSLYDSPYYVHMQNSIKARNPNIKETDLIVATIKQIDLVRPFFSRIALQPAGKGNLSWVPYGLVHELRSPGEPPVTHEEYTKKTESIWNQITLPDIRTTKNVAAKNLTLVDIPTYYANSLLEAGSYFQTTLHDLDTAYVYYQKALKVDPTYAKTYAVLGVYFADGKKECSKGADYLEKAVDLNPSNSLYYFHLYTVDRVCAFNTKGLSDIQKKYQKYFGSSLEQDLKKYLEKGEKDSPSAL